MSLEVRVICDGCGAVGFPPGDNHPDGGPSLYGTLLWKVEEKWALCDECNRAINLAKHIESNRAEAEAGRSMALRMNREQRAEKNKTAARVRKTPWNYNTGGGS